MRLSIEQLEVAVRGLLGLAIAGVQLDEQTDPHRMDRLPVHRLAARNGRPVRRVGHPGENDRVELRVSARDPKREAAQAAGRIDTHGDCDMTILLRQARLQSVVLLQGWRRLAVEPWRRSIR